MARDELRTKLFLSEAHDLELKKKDTLRGQYGKGWPRTFELYDELSAGGKVNLDLPSTDIKLVISLYCCSQIPQPASLRSLTLI